MIYKCSWIFFSLIQNIAWFWTEMNFCCKYFEKNIHIFGKNRNKRKMSKLPIPNVPSISFTPNAIICRNLSKSFIKLFEPLPSKSSRIIYSISLNVGYLLCSSKINRFTDVASLKRLLQELLHDMASVWRWTAESLLLIPVH